MKTIQHERPCVEVERPRRLSIQDYTPRFKGGSTVRELAPDPSALARTLKRVMLTIRTEPLTDAELVSEIGIVDQALVMVNSRGHTLDLYNAAKAWSISLPARRPRTAAAAWRRYPTI